MPKVVDVIVGKDVRLNCEVKENGVNTSWLKNNETISPSDHPRMRLKFNKYLKIKGVQKDDAGFYTCVAENGCGRNLYKIQLLVGSELTLYYTGTNNVLIVHQIFSLALADWSKLIT